MKNFETNYPVEGTSALKPKYDMVSAQRACIIAFPEDRVRRVARMQPASACTNQGSFMHRVESTVTSAMAGTAQGSSFGRMQRWQAVAAGCVFSALAFGSLLLCL